MRERAKSGSMDQSAWLCFRLTAIEMESEIRGEFQCVVRFVLGKLFSGPMERDDGERRREVDDEQLDELMKICRTIIVVVCFFIFCTFYNYFIVHQNLF